MTRIFHVALFFLLFPVQLHAAQSSGPPSPYKSLEPPFIVNLNDGKRMRFLQVKLQAQVDKDPLSAPALELHMPAVRHEILMLLSRQSFDNLQTLEGKETLLKDITQSVRDSLTRLSGKPAVDQVLMTGFIIQ